MDSSSFLLNQLVVEGIDIALGVMLENTEIPFATHPMIFCMLSRWQS